MKELRQEQHIEETGINVMEILHKIVREFQSKQIEIAKEIWNNRKSNK